MLLWKIIETIIFLCLSNIYERINSFCYNASCLKMPHIMVLSRGHLANGGALRLMLRKTWHLNSGTFYSFLWWLKIYCHVVFYVWPLCGTFANDQKFIVCKSSCSKIVSIVGNCLAADVEESGEMKTMRWQFSKPDTI